MSFSNIERVVILPSRKKRPNEMTFRQEDVYDEKSALPKPTSPPWGDLHRSDIPEVNEVLDRLGIVQTRSWWWEVDYHAPFKTFLIAVLKDKGVD